MEIAIQGLATAQNYDDFDKSYRLIKEAGFTAIDWSIDLVWDRAEIKKGIMPNGTIYDGSLDEIEKHFEDELKAIRKYGLKITQAHAPFPAYIEGKPEFTEYCIEIFKKAILLCDRVGCKNLVIHGITAYPDNKTDSYDDIVKLNMHMYTSLIPTLVNTNVTVCLENLFVSANEKRYAGTCCDPHEACEYIDRLNETAGKECFGLCFDTGHINLVHCYPERYIQILGKRIKALHIHDNDMMNDRHLAPYTGLFRWDRFTHALREIGYDGDLSFETFKQTDNKYIHDRMVPHFLKLIYECGVLFRDIIEGREE